MGALGPTLWSTVWPSKVLETPDIGTVPAVPTLLGKEAYEGDAAMFTYVVCTSLAPTSFSSSLVGPTQPLAEVSVGREAESLPCWVRKGRHVCVQPTPAQVS